MNKIGVESVNSFHYRFREAITKSNIKHRAEYNTLDPNGLG